MIRDPQSLEPGVLRLYRLRNEFVWAPLLTRQEVANLHVIFLRR